MVEKTTREVGLTFSKAKLSLFTGRICLIYLSYICLTHTPNFRFDPLHSLMRPGSMFYVIMRAGERTEVNLQGFPIPETICQVIHGKLQDGQSANQSRFCLVSLRKDLTAKSTREFCQLKTT